jgi:integrase
MLTDKECRTAECPPEKKRARLTDSGGLYLEVSPAGSKRWFWKFYAGSKEGRMALGSYPEVTLASARRQRDLAKLQKADGHHPVHARRAAKLRVVATDNDSFKDVALEWHGKQVGQWSDGHAIRAKRQLERDFFPWVGHRRLRDIDAAELLGCLRKIEERGALETADRGLMVCRQVWRYGIASGRADADVTASLKDALTPYRSKHFAAITDPTELSVLLRAIQAYRGGVIVKSALQLAPILFQRPGELRGAAWSEMDLVGRLWTIPARRMKREKAGKEHGDPHLVPLSTQAVQILADLKRFTGHGHLVFPGERDHERPISENSVRTALISIGYGPDRHTWHGFRATARTLLAEHLNCDPLVIEAQLAHSVRDPNGRAYNRTQYLTQRTAMMQRWADYLVELANGPAAK